MAHNIHGNMAEIEKLELQARQLRAEAIAYGFRSFRDWTTSAFRARAR
jgi:hypothetical protein